MKNFVVLTGLVVFGIVALAVGGVAMIVQKITDRG